MVSRRFFTLLLPLSLLFFACQLVSTADPQVIERVTATPGPVTPSAVPTDTPTPSPSPTTPPTATPSPTPLPTAPLQPTATDPPNYPSLVIFTGDLPAGFFPVTGLDEMWQVGEYFNMQTEIRTAFYYSHPETFEFVHGFTTLQSTTFEQDSFDLSLHLQQFRYRLFGPDVKVEEVTTAETVGDASVLLSAVLEIVGTSYQQYCIAFRQDTIGVVICYLYPRTVEPSISPVELAQLLDQRIVLLLGSD
jgi:hypothetical protein